MRRRQVMKWGAGLGAAAGAGVLMRVLVPPRPSRELAPVPESAARLYDALDERERADATVPYDHPLRQYHNRGVDTGGVWAVTLGGTARSHLVDLVHASLSERGRERVPHQMLLTVSGVHFTRVLFCGRPDEPNCQILVTGPHLNLRIGGRNREGVAFGGPQVYGDQRGNGEIGLPGNVYRYQLELGQQLIESLSRGAREEVRQRRAPPQAAVEVQGADGTFSGVAVADLPLAQRRGAHAFIDGVLQNYGDADAAYAWECITANGGVDAFHLADYEVDFEGGREAGAAPSQIIRLEAPGAVFHYRGEPHLHAFFNVARDADAPLSLGDDLGVNPTPRDVEGVAQLFEHVLRSQPGADLGYYPRTSVAGLLRAGMIREGDIYNLESWRENIAMLNVRGDALQGPAREAVLRQHPIRDDSSYRVATIGYVAGNAEDLGISRVDAVTEGDPLRDATIAYLRNNDFPPFT